MFSAEDDSPLEKLCREYAVSDCERRILELYFSFKPERRKMVCDFVNEFVKKIIVHEADKSSGSRRQTVEIVFNFVGQIEIPILTEPITLEASPKQRKTA